MVERLSILDASFLYAEQGAAAMHVGGVALFEQPSAGLDFDALVDHIESRLPLAPRFRQKVRTVPGGIGRPVWVDDPDFDIRQHVRRTTVPRPGNHEQLCQLVARVMSRSLDRRRPLWEMYVVVGLEGDRYALVSKTHHALVDGVAAVDLAQVLLDPSPAPFSTPREEWSPRPEPSDADLVRDALTDLAIGTQSLAASLLRAAPDPGALLRTAGGAAAGIASTLRAVATAPPRNALASDLALAPKSTGRRFATVSTELAHHKVVRRHSEATINDVVLAVVTGALRAWLIHRGDDVSESTTVRAMVPVSMRAPRRVHGSASGRGAQAMVGNDISAFFVELPVGQSDPMARLRNIAKETRSLKESGQAMGASTMIALAGYTPTTVHSLAARMVNTMSSRVFEVVVTNVPGPQVPLYADGARLLEAYPVVPLAHGQAVAIGVTSYDGGVYYGLFGDREAMDDLEVLERCMYESLAELVAACDVDA